MSKYIKDMLRDELKKSLENVDNFLVVETKGVGGNENNEMRGVLKEKGIRMKVVKNSAMRAALDALGKTVALNLFLAGPSTVVYGGDSIVDVAKEIEQCAKKAKELKVKGAFVDGEVMDTAAATALAKMPNRAELQGEIVILATSPGANLGGAIVGPGGVIAGCIESLVEKLEKEAA